MVGPRTGTVMIVVNGVAHAELSPLDRGFAYGDGVFRTFPVHGGKPLHWRRHYAKLVHDCVALSIPAPDAASLELDIDVACAGLDRAAAKIVVTRGAGERGYRYATGAAPSRVVIASAPPAYPEDYARAGVAVRLCELRLGHQPALAGIKHLNRLENVLARAEWREPEPVEGILRDGAGHVISGTMTNLFAVLRGRLVTPALDRCGVAGVTRDRVIEAAARSCFECEVRDVSWDELQDADEVFLTNSLAGVWPVRELAGVVRSPGPVTRAIQRALEQEDHAQTA